MSANETKFTPGIFTASFPEGSNGYAYISTDGHDGDVATCWSASWNALETAQLFAAAPELFHELTCLRGEIAADLAEAGYSESDILEHLRSADAALAKSLGK